MNKASPDRSRLNQRKAQMRSVAMPPRSDYDYEHEHEHERSITRPQPT